MIESLYVIGSLRNGEIPEVGSFFRREGIDVFDDWYSAGPDADDRWRDYEKARGRTYREALDGYAAKNVFAFDHRHLERCGAVLLVLPAGRSGHLELGYAIGRGKRGFVLIDDPERWDVMYQFAEKVFLSKEEALDYFQRTPEVRSDDETRTARDGRLSRSDWQRFFAPTYRDLRQVS